MPGAPLLEFHRVSLRDGEIPVLTEVSLTVHEAEIVGVVFQHGIGKTSLLYIGAGLMPPTAGEVVYRGRRIAELPKTPPKLGFVFEDDGGLLENTSVFDNVALPLRFHLELEEKEVARKVEEVLSLVGMEEQAGRFPWQLTGDRQRLVALARALVYEPELVFVDDFFLGADADAFRRMQEAISLAREAHETAFLLVMEASAADFGVADRLCLVDHGAVLELERDG
ncbi:MAG TPA: ATP-binding cassette domain-containing protein [Polyangiaceae bacterium LLY-WYZ-15_(1-7)]|nr:hypothetical protein [Myxococcales bacterium]MAT24794.1 hypothetical protein [Sandaracinus sp.]HJK91119.1 ATP-binding cassette domain-containing protein [Polyangiaceae bacterium LLY-WYZ-15_(1-7)]HJL02425.1 ATP-binding cassette domain-containing protein [Polyangiaceae bacterium LLY-WYZ-15_(1-7)]HJL11715.1 ATP-binding cassette domain-containing protein [Polyangiaceae bacterium LLY-WYZ-15_(1-7)]